jgi:hypothetical protein
VGLLELSKENDRVLWRLFIDSGDRTVDEEVTGSLKTLSNCLQTRMAEIAGLQKAQLDSLAIQKRSSEVWKLLGAVKAEFGKFGIVLDGVKKKLDQASHTMDDAAKRSRAMERKLRGVEELPAPEAQSLLAESSIDLEAVLD